MDPLNKTEGNPCENNSTETSYFCDYVKDYITDAIYALDLEGKLIHGNRNVFDITGYSADELIGKHFSFLFDAATMPQIQELFIKVAVHGESVLHYETEIIRKDGDKRVVSITAVPFMRDGKITEVVGAGKDITERKKIEESQRKSEEASRRHLAEIQTIYSTAPIGLCFVDTNLRYININEKLAEIAGITVENHIGRTIREVLPQIADCVEDHCRTVIETGKPIEGLEVHGETPAQPGIQRYWLANYYPVKDGSGNVFGVNVAVQEITERKNSEEQIIKLNKDLQRYSEELEVAYEDMESFSYSVCHDLRGPLRIISGVSEILMKNYHHTLDDKGKDFLKLILENIKRMDQLILALLALCKSGRQDMKIVEIDMEKTATLIAGDLKAMAPERNIAVAVGKLPPAHGDLALIRQVLTNLLSNAIKFTKGRDVAYIEVGGLCEESENVYYVKDNGAGFNPGLEDKLFKVFQRLHSEQEFKGAGIGLSIVYRIISRHNGRVWAEGRPDEGATFYFSLPGEKE